METGATRAKWPLTLEDFWRLKTVDDVQLSPDGGAVAYVVGCYDEAHDEWHSAIWLADVTSGESRQFTSGEASDAQPRWSPDGTRLAFVSTRQEGKPQVFVMPVGGGEPRQLTRAANGATAPVWSPDGARLCYAAAVDSDRQRVASETDWLDAHGEVDAKGPRLRRQNTLVSRFDGRGYIDRRVHLFVVDVREGDEAEPRQLTDGDCDDLDAAWSPDGASIAFVSNRAEDAEHTFAIDVWTVSAADGALTMLTRGELTAAAPAWSPDGDVVAFYAAPDWTQAGYGDAHLWVVSRQGGDERDLFAGAGLDRGFRFVQGDYHFPSAPPLDWSPDGATVYALAIDHGDSAVYALDLFSATRRVSASPANVAGLRCTPDGRTLVVLASTPQLPFDLCTIPAAGGALAPLVATNRALLDITLLARTERRAWLAPDGWEIEGWLVTPPGADPADAEKPYPLILHVHGGPYGAWGHTFYLQAQALAGQGYASFYANPRGSLGYGQAFSRAADWGEKDFADLMAGVDALIADGVADPARVGITGISYGGFMTNWALGHSDRFAAGVSVNGVSNQISMYGTSDMSALWLEQEFDGPFWDGDEALLRYWRHSPLAYVDRIAAPLLLLQSENDYRCPIEQGEQMLTALRVRRRVVELVRFPGASHVIAASAAPHHRLLQWTLTLDWFDRYVKCASPGATDTTGARSVNSS